MKHSLFFLLSFSLLSTTVFSQQDPMFTKYMFNGLVYNPAYAGAKDHLSATVLHRDQWLGIDGAPTTQTFTVHTPLNDPRVAVGLSFYSDKIGPVSQMNFSASYAYRIIFNKDTEKESKLSFGLQASATNRKSDLNQLLLQNPDPVFMNTPTSRLLPNFGGGILYYTKMWYLGMAVPNILENSLRDPITGLPNEFISQQYRHYFLTGGLAINIGGHNEDLIFKPSFVIKNSNLFGFGQRGVNNINQRNVGAPTEFDIDVSFFFFKTLWVGASFRSAFEGANETSSGDSVDLWAAFYLRNGFRIGAAYDYTITELGKITDGSYELMLSYELNFSKGTIVTPRYF